MNTSIAPLTHTSHPRVIQCGIEQTFVIEGTGLCIVSRLQEFLLWFFSFVSFLMNPCQVFFSVWYNYDFTHCAVFFFCGSDPSLARPHSFRSSLVTKPQRDSSELIQRSDLQNFPQGFNFFIRNITSELRAVCSSARSVSLRAQCHVRGNESAVKVLPRVFVFLSEYNTTNKSSLHLVCFL